MPVKDDVRRVREWNGKFEDGFDVNLRSDSDAYAQI